MPQADVPAAAGHLPAACRRGDAPDRGRVRDEPAIEDTGPEEPSGDGASDGTTRRRRRRGGRSRGHEADGESRRRRRRGRRFRAGPERAEAAERGGKSAEAKQADGKSGQGKGKGTEAKSAQGKAAQTKAAQTKAAQTKAAEGKQAQEKAEGKPGGADDQADHEDIDGDEDGNGTRRRRRRRRRGSASDGEPAADDPPNTVVHVRVPRPHTDEPVSVGDVKAVRGSTRLEAKRQRRREGRESGRRRPPVITESEFLARRESVDRVMVVRQQDERTQIGVLEDGVLVEHYVDKGAHQSFVGNVYLGKVQNVLPSMEAAFVDIGKGRNAVLYAGEVNFDASGLEGDSKRIESALKSGQSVLVQVTKDPVGHKGARLTSQVSLPGRYLVYVPGGSMMGISRKLPDKERTRLKQILKQVMPEGAGVIVRTAAEGASEEELAHDVARLSAQWEAIEQKSKTANAPELLYSEPDLTIRVVRDIFNEDFASLVVEGDEGWDLVYEYVRYVAPHLADRLTHWAGRRGRVRPVPDRRAAGQGAGAQGLAAQRRLAGHRQHRGHDRGRRQHREVHRAGREPGGDRDPEQPGSGGGDRPAAPAAGCRRHHRHRLHRHGPGEQPGAGAAPDAGMPGPGPDQAPGRRGHLPRPGPDDPQAGRVRAAGGLL